MSNTLEDIEFIPGLTDILPEEFKSVFNNLLEIAVFSRSESERYHAELSLFALSYHTIKRVFVADNALLVTFEYTDRFRKSHQRTFHYKDLSNFTGSIIQIEYNKP
jgi:hypothetical protein